MRIRTLINTLSVASILVGTIGGLGALPYAFSNAMIDVVGAGMVFLSGSVLIAAGLTAMSRVAASAPASQRAQLTESATPA